MSNIVGPKGQVVIEKSIRDTLKLEPGYITIQKLVDDHVELYFFPPEHNKSLRGILAGHTKKSVTPEQWSSLKESAWEDNIQI
jgi:bifunctional DNA-binding transcriptional regulator/antitoxin component of YhaV-PrlF toxin-antitoxin module